MWTTTTGTVRIERSGWHRRIHLPVRTPSMIVDQVGCTDVVCSAGSCMSTGELHARIFAPHARPARELERTAGPDEHREARKRPRVLPRCAYHEYHL
jgi:hypothetical protein